jgi:hypothetical protein
MTNSDRHSSLLPCVIDFGRRKACTSGPPGACIIKLFMAIYCCRVFATQV